LFKFDNSKIELTSTLIRFVGRICRQIQKSVFGIGLFLLVCKVSANEVHLPENPEDVTLQKISNRIYVVHGLHELPNSQNKGLISNSGVILTDSGVVIVDSGGGLEVGRRILELIKQVTDMPVIAVFNTHIHGDHWLGNMAVRTSYPSVQIYAHERAIKRLNEGEAENWLQIITTMTGLESAGAEVVLPDKALHGDEQLSFGGHTLVIHHTGHAHTDSDIMVEVPSAKTLFTGDIVEHGRAVSSDVPQDFNAKGQIEAIKYALQLPVDIYVPGHGATGGKEIPEASLLFLEALYVSVKKYYDEGLQDFEMKNKVIADMAVYSSWFNFEELGRLVSFVYLQIEEEDF
jgi:glyoxylase-like metal-dependent hydrolase (beta-lactamase superfamily II)